MKILMHNQGKMRIGGSLDPVSQCSRFVRFGFLWCDRSVQIKITILEWIDGNGNTVFIWYQIYRVSWVRIADFVRSHGYLYLSKDGLMADSDDFKAKFRDCLKVFFNFHGCIRFLFRLRLRWFRRKFLWLAKYSVMIPLENSEGKLYRRLLMLTKKCSGHQIFVCLQICVFLIVAD